MQNPFVIPDGFTLDGHTDPEAGTIRETRFKYRLAKPAIVSHVGSIFGEGKAQAKAKAVAEHTSNWRVVNDDGSEEQIAVSAELLLNAPARILETAYAYVTMACGADIRQDVGK